MSYNRAKSFCSGTKLLAGRLAHGSALGEEVLRAPQLLRPGEACDVAGVRGEGWVGQKAEGIT